MQKQVLEIKEALTVLAREDNLDAIQALKKLKDLSELLVRIEGDLNEEAKAN